VYAFRSALLACEKPQWDQKQKASQTQEKKNTRRNCCSTENASLDFSTITKRGKIQEGGVCVSRGKNRESSRPPIFLSTGEK
jgi:hypothetical protein